MLALCIESSHTRGMGHLYRSLILADHLRARGHNITYLINNHPPSLAILQQRGYTPIAVDLPDTQSHWEMDIIKQHHIKLWINDRLDTSIAHAEHIKAAPIPLATFDDQGTGATLADLHIAALNTHSKLAAGKRVLQGAEYLILNPDIAKFQRVRQRADSILVTLGGSDTYGVTVKIVTLLSQLKKSATVIIGPAFEHQQALEVVLTNRFTVKRGVPSMIEEMSYHDIAITGGGITPFEANAAGLPCIIIANETFEIPNGELLQRLGSSVFAGYHTTVDESLFAKDLPMETMSKNGIKHIGLGGASKVVAALEALL